MKMCINGVDVKVKLRKSVDGGVDLMIRPADEPREAEWYLATLQADGRLDVATSVPTTLGLQLDERRRVKLTESSTDSPVSPPAPARTGRTTLVVNGRPVELWVERYGPEAALMAQACGRLSANLIFFNSDGSASLAAASMSDTFGLPFKADSNKRLAIEGLVPESDDSLADRLRKIADLLDE